ncbi:MAG TPA: hypothetical protein VLA77_01545 [Candidatus Saccharimonadales bacterium]|nr:hypothetical protein [Candidatus Saccharimonadales bacterium]
MLSFREEHKKRWPWLVVAILVVLPTSYIAILANLQLPQVTVNQRIFSHEVDTGVSDQITWPDSDQAAVFVPDLNVVKTFGEQKPQPTASVAKAMTGLALMRKSPLAAGEQGQFITISDQDVAIYRQYVADGGSVFAVSAGQQLTQYQAMQALLLPSANNMAVTLTRWAFGSDQAYIDYANQLAKDLGMKNTNIADASGFSEQTTSTTEDLVILGNAVLKEPVLAQIVNQKSAQILGREVNNVNTSLGVAGINGIKTGFTFAAGGCLLFSSTKDVFGKPTTVIGAILGAETRDVALAYAPKIVESSWPNIIQVNPVAERQVIADVTTEWGEKAQIISNDAINFVLWKGSPLNLEVMLDKQKLTGEISVASQTQQLELSNKINEPNLWWRLTHPRQMLASYVR